MHSILLFIFAGEVVLKMHSNWFFIVVWIYLMHTTLKCAASCVHYSDQRKEKTHEIKSVRLGGWVVADRLDEPPGRGDTNKTVSHMLVWWSAFAAVLIVGLLASDVTCLFSPVALGHQPQHVRLMKFLHGKGFTSRLLQPAHFRGTAPADELFHLHCQDQTASLPFSWADCLWWQKSVCVC